MGGHDGGSIAAQAAVEAFLIHSDSPDPWNDVLSSVNTSVREALTANRCSTGGSTLVALVLRTESAEIVHLGDSRGYRLRPDEDQATVLTSDHNVEVELRAAGQSVEMYRSQFGRTDALTRYLGGDQPMVPTVTPVSPSPGDRFLLCSDGIHGAMDLSTISDCLRAKSCGLAADDLIEASLEAGGHDNATALVLDF